MSNSQIVINHIKKRKKDLVEVLGGKCCICGFNSFIEALEFHHVDPSTKKFGIGQSGSMTKALDKQLEEIRKCVLVCANCHRGIHGGYIDVPENYSTYYNEQIASQLLQECHNKKFGQIRYCLRCGKVINRQSTYCLECRAFVSRRAERPDREKLKFLIRTMPFTKIAEFYGVTDNAIRKWCVKYNLPKKKTEINNIADEDWEKI